jgi:hypothetical protein
MQARLPTWIQRQELGVAVSLTVVLDGSSSNREKDFDHGNHHSMLPFLVRELLVLYHRCHERLGRLPKRANRWKMAHPLSLFERHDLHLGLLESPEGTRDRCSLASDLYQMVIVVAL